MVWNLGFSVQLRELFFRKVILAETKYLNIFQKSQKGYKGLGCSIWVIINRSCLPVVGFLCPTCQGFYGLS